MDMQRSTMLRVKILASLDFTTIRPNIDARLNPTLLK